MEQIRNDYKKPILEVNVCCPEFNFRYNNTTPSLYIIFDDRMGICLKVNNDNYIAEIPISFCPFCGTKITYRQVAVMAE